MNTNSVVLAPRGLFSYAIPTRPTCVRRFQDSRPLLATRRTLVLPFDMAIFFRRRFAGFQEQLASD